MPMIQSSASVALSSVNDNVLAGSQFEFLPYNALLEFGLNGDANGADLRIDIYSGQDVVVEQLTPSIQNRVPVYPDDYIGSDIAAAGERIKIRVRNTSAAAARTIFFAVRITPV
jgi:hypothetical protein